MQEMHDVCECLIAIWQKEGNYRDFSGKIGNIYSLSIILDENILFF